MRDAWPAGTRALGLGAGRDGLVHVPGAAAAGEVPLVAFLHGAGGHARGALAALGELPERRRFALLVPESRGPTWDLILGDFGPDVAFIDAALARVREHVRVDPAKVVLAGFSDGASYALSLGLGRGETFTHVVAFSPGFAAPPARAADPRPAIFVAHGTRDGVLPIERCSRRIVPALRRAGYDLTYREFDGGHVVPPDLAEASLDWLAGAAPPR